MLATKSKEPTKNKSETKAKERSDHQQQPDVNPVWNTLATSFAPCFGSPAGAPPPIQAKLTISQPNDPYEQEADRVADQVMRMPDPALAESSIDSTPIRGLSVQRKCAACGVGSGPCPKCEAEQGSMLHRKADAASGSSVSSDAAEFISHLGPGQPLDLETRAFFEPRLGHDFSHVRVHDGEQAVASAKSINARAYTIGSNMVFGAGEYAPESGEGRSLLAHELTHVVQQDGSQGVRAGWSNEKHGLSHDISPGDSLVLQREEAASGRSQGDRVDLSELKYVCIFVGQDLYGIQARRYVKTVMLEHHLIEASSMEEAMVKMRDHSRVALKGGAAARIAEVVLIAHGNATGFVKIPLIKGHKGTTPEEIAKLQEDFLAGARQKFQETRAEVLGLFDGTQVIVRGCRVGRSQEAVDALAAFFGGQATVYAAKEYQAFTRREISSFDKDPRQAAIKAFDHLAMQGFVPKQIVVTDDEKVRWVAAHLPDRYVPESFFVDEADVDKVRHAGADDAAIQALKDYESAQLIGVDKWGVSKSARPEDAELDPMTANQIVTLAGERLVKLRRLEKDSPDDWRNIGEEAWWVLRCHNAWSRKPEAMQINLEKMDPIGGLWMPGLSYDINLLAMQAARRPDLKVFHSDAFASANLVMPAGQTSEVVEGGLEVQEGRTNQPSKPEAQPSSRFRGSGAAALPKQGEMKMGEDRISPNPVMPVPPLGVDLSIPGGRKAATALVMRGEFKRQFEIKYERQLGYLKVKKAVVEFNGKIDFKTEGEKELVIGAFGALATKPGESVSGGGDKLEVMLAKGQDKQTGVSGKVTGGLDIGGQGRTKEGDSGSSTARGMKTELYLGTQVAWGPIAQELKLVIVGIDETKSGTDMFTILGIKWSPIVVQGDFELPVSDGTNVKFAGSVKLTIEAEPDWVMIGARLGQTLGRQVAVEAGAITAGGTAAAGTAAGTGVAETTVTAAGGAAVGELVIAGGFVAVAAAMVYAYYKSVVEIEDLKELQRGSNQGVKDFCGGYLAYLGISGAGQPSGALWKEGQRHAEIQLKARVKRAAHFFNERTQKQLFADEDPELREKILGGIKKDAASWRMAVYFSYETAVRTLFYKVWLARVRGTASERNALYARANAGLSSVDPSDEPDYSWVNAVGRRGAVGMRRPAHAR